MELALWGNTKKFFKYLAKNPIIIFIIIIGCFSYWVNQLQSENYDLKYNSDGYKETIINLKTDLKSIESKSEMVGEEWDESKKKVILLTKKLNEVDTDDEVKDKNIVFWADDSTKWNQLKSAIDSISYRNTRFPE